MKKPFFAVLLAALAAVSLAAQTGGGAFSLLNTRVYSEYFGFKNGVVDPDNDFIFEAPRAERKGNISNLGGEQGYIDTPLELALFSYYAASRIDIRPVEAKEMLPASNPRLADLKLGAATYMDMQVARFTGSDAAPYAAALKFITDRGKVSEADIKKFMAQGIAAEVDAQFNKINIPLYRYNAVLTRTTGNQYVLSYKDVNDVVKGLPPASLETLLATMRRTTGFEASDIDAVRAQAVLIPAVRLNSGALDDIKRILTNFYTSPNASTYNAVKEVYALYTDARLTTGEAIFEKTRLGYVAALTILNESLARKVIADAEKQGTYTSLTREQQQRFITLR
jgi:hypothetical protein